jgi:hypothetical protein
MGLGSMGRPMLEVHWQVVPCNEGTNRIEEKAALGAECSIL